MPHVTHVVTSRGGVPIRLTDERWAHIVEEHSELSGMRHHILEAVAEADRVLSGGRGELLAAQRLETGKALVVVYREVSSDDGFVITAFLTSRWESLNRRHQVWPRKT